MLGLAYSLCGHHQRVGPALGLRVGVGPRVDESAEAPLAAFVGGQLSIEHQPHLDSLDALYGVRRIGGNLELSNNRLLDALDVSALRDSIGESAIGCYLEPEF